METEIAKVQEILKRDFFGGLWDNLESKTQQLLAQIEVHSNTNRIADMARDIRPVLELELAATFPLLAPMADHPDRHLVLTRMKKALEEYPVTRGYIDGLKIRSEDKAFLKDQLPDYLRRVIDCGDYFKEDSYQGDEVKHSRMAAEALDIRKNLLGIGCEGILQRLATIKKVIHSYPPGAGGALP